MSKLNWHSHPNDYDSNHPRKLSRINAVPATLLLLLGLGALAFLAWTQYLLIVLLLIPVLLSVVALISALWRAIYDTLQEGKSSQAT